MTHIPYAHTNKQNNYTQVIALAKSFPLRWPAALNTLFEIQGAVSTLGDHIVNVDCVSATASGAELFYSKQVMYALTPILTGLAGFLFWYAHGLRRGTPFFAKREQNSTKTPKDKFVVTVTAIIFLMYPTLCNQALLVQLQMGWQQTVLAGRPRRAMLRGTPLEPGPCSWRVSASRLRHRAAHARALLFAA